MDRSQIASESGLRVWTAAAILLVGYLGSAVAVQARISHPLFGYTPFPVYVAVLLWGGLYLRDSRVRALISLRSNP